MLADEDVALGDGEPLLADPAIPYAVIVSIRPSENTAARPGPQSESYAVSASGWW